MNVPKLDFVHHFVAAPEVEKAPTLLLLHGTGGNENDLLELGRTLAPSANRLSPRGKVLENGMPRFFRRLMEGVFDEEDLIFRTHELADFVSAAAEHYGFSKDNIIALGYSNGANIAAGLLLLRPETLAKAVLLRAMVPLVPESLPVLNGRKIFLSSGLNDPSIPIENARRLAGILGHAGAGVTFHETQTGHQLSSDELNRARMWLEEK